MLASIANPILTLPLRLAFTGPQTPMTQSKRMKMTHTPPQPAPSTVTTPAQTNPCISVEVVGDADLERWKELSTSTTLFDKAVRGFNKITIPLQDVHTFTEEDGLLVIGTKILGPKPGWTLSLGAYGWGQQGGTMVMEMCNKAMLQGGKKFGRLHYAMDFCNISKISQGAKGSNDKQEWTTINFWLKTPPTEGEVAYSTKSRGRHGMRELPHGSIAHYLKTGKTNLGSEPDPSSLLRRRVRKQFGDEQYEGSVASIDTDSKNESVRARACMCIRVCVYK